MLQQEIPMKWVVVIFAALAACMIFGWVYITTPSWSERSFAKCMQTKSNDPDKKKFCRLGVAFAIAADKAKAACVSHEGSKVQKCVLLPAEDDPKKVDQWGAGSDTDVNIITHLTFRDDWNDVRFADYMVRLTRAPGDDPNWHVANSEFSVQPK